MSFRGRRPVFRRSWNSAWQAWRWRNTLRIGKAAGSIDSSRPPGRLSVIAPDRNGDIRAHRWMRLPAAAAVLALVALAGLLVLYRAVPAPSEFPAIPAAAVILRAMNRPWCSSISTHPCGACRTARPGPFWNSVCSRSLRQVVHYRFGWYTLGRWPVGHHGGERSHSRSSRPDPPSLFPRVPARAAQEFPPGQRYCFGPNDTLVYSTAGCRDARNPGSETDARIFGRWAS